MATTSEDMLSKTSDSKAAADAVMPTYGRVDLSFVRGDGSYLYTADETAYLDCASGIAVTTLGHNHSGLRAALHDQIDKLWHTSNLFRIPGQEKLALRLAKAAKLDQVFFCNSGAEANEAAVKMARRYQYRSGQTNRNRIICAGGAFHGRTLAMLAATDRPIFREGFGPLPVGFDHVPFGNMNALRDALGPDVAAIMIEPVQGEGGANAAPDGYLQAVREAADEFGVLMIADEVQSGMGRAGYMFSYQASGCQPDLVVLAKGLGGGFPVGAVIARAQIGAAMGPGSHGSTFGGNPLAMAAGNAVMDVLEDDTFMQDVRARAEYLDAGLQILAAEMPAMIAELRGAGFLRGVTLSDGYEAGVLCAALRERHILTVPAAENTLRLLPPLTISQTEIDTVLAGLKDALTHLAT